MFATTCQKITCDQPTIGDLAPRIWQLVGGNQPARLRFQCPRQPHNDQENRQLDEWTGAAEACAQPLELRRSRNAQQTPPTAQQAFPIAQELLNLSATQIRKFKWRRTLLHSPPKRIANLSATQVVVRSPDRTTKSAGAETRAQQWTRAQQHRQEHNVGCCHQGQPARVFV
jgi:hypothetical protein